MTKNIFSTICHGFSNSPKIEYTVKDSLHFSEEICEQDPKLSIGSLGVDLLFTKILLDQTVDSCVSELFENNNAAKAFEPTTT